uniref:Peptidase S1 domain-containing protein n=1 Tax=Labrus bergylta TaxID=56723 RepID=A0A3Q3GM00_9LABR
KDPPPPYYPTSIHTLPPLKSYEEKKRRRCCNNNAQCFGGSGGSLLVVGLLALAIWLGRFKSDGQLQVKTAEDGSFQPVCYSGWNQSHANQTCAQLGFRCGKQQSTARIIGGAAAKSGQWPWQLSLHHRGSHICGAVLISPDFVLTAAHCIPKVYGGVMSLNSLPSPYLVEKIILNHNYNSTTHDQDIALLKLKSPVVFNQPVCLPAFDFSFSHGTRCWTSGFGVTDVDKTVSRELMEVFVSIISTAMCNSRHGYGGAVTGNMICAGTLQGGRDSCQGDSGGPLMCESENRWYLVGITSWGDSCGLRNKPGVYTRVSSLLSWIYSTMQ